MGESSKIEWTDHTMNPWWGCTKVSPGCEHCYAETFSKRVGHGKRLPMVWGPNAERKMASETTWLAPLLWNEHAKKSGERKRVFCLSMGDVGEDRPDLAWPRMRLTGVIEETPWLDWLLLSKRPENLTRLFAEAGWKGAWPFNVVAMTTVEDQRRADERIPELLRVPASRFGVSYEPALGLVRFPWRWCVRFGVEPERYAETHLHCHDDGLVRRIDWIIVGGESGPGARPFDLAWARSTIAQCKDAGAACFVKQLGTFPLLYNFGGDRDVRMKQWANDLATKLCVRLDDSKGGNWNEWPADLRVRQFYRPIEVPS